MKKINININIMINQRLHTLKDMMNLMISIYTVTMKFMKNISNSLMFKLAAAVAKENCVCCR